MAKKYSRKQKRSQSRNKHKSIKRRRNALKKRLIKKGGGTFGIPTETFMLPENTYLYVGEYDDTFVPLIEAEKIQFEGKNVGEMSGCFCPPHAGHYQTIYNACLENKLNVMFLKTINSNNRPERTRHGVPSAFTIKMLYYFAKQIHSELGTEFYITNSAQGIPWSINTSMDNLYLINVVETHGEPTEADYEYGRQIQAKNPLEKTSRRFLENFDKENNTKVQNVVLYRNKDDGYSATQFIQNLIKLANEPYSDETYAKVTMFIPYFFDDEEKHMIISDIIDDYGAYLQ
jgi:hypothetical protein